MTRMTSKELKEMIEFEDSCGINTTLQEVCNGEIEIVDEVQNENK